MSDKEVEVLKQTVEQKRKKLAKLVKGENLLDNLAFCVLFVMIFYLFLAFFISSKDLSNTQTKIATAIFVCSQSVLFLSLKVIILDHSFNVSNLIKLSIIKMLEQIANQYQENIKIMKKHNYKKSIFLCIGIIGFITFIVYVSAI